MVEDPFAGLEDQPPLSPAGARRELLESARRGYAPIGNVFVQHPPASPIRPSALAQFVTKRQERALDALLLFYALLPVIGDDPLPLGAWANILSTRRPCSISTASKVFRVLEEMKLISRTRAGHLTSLQPRREDCSGAAWRKPGLQTVTTDGPSEGFFTLPHEYWNDGFADTLRLPGKAMLLIMLKETQGRPTFSMPVEKAAAWYGISERSAERGYGELNKLGLLETRVQRVSSPRLPPGVRREVYHRALRHPFSTSNRRALQVAAVSRVTGRTAGRS